MKAFLTSVLAILCIALIVGGNMHWENKIQEAVKVEHAAEEEDARSKKEKTDKEEKSDKDKKDNENDKIASMMAFTANWPEEAAEKFEKSLQNEEPFKIVFAGSESLGEGDESWPALVEKELIDTYGKSFISIDTHSYSLSSHQFLENGKNEKMAEAEADFLILEPFTLNDNGVVPIETSENNIDAMIEAVKDAKDDTVIVLQPPHPLYNASYYSNQVDSLATYAMNHKIDFINHWEAWPELDSQDINDYLTDDREAPNKDGHKLWAEYMTDYLITK